MSMRNGGVRNSPEQLIARAQALFRLRGHRQVSLELVDAVLKKRPAGAALYDAWRLKGLILAARERHGDATKAFKRALASRPGDEELQLRLGVSLVQEGRPKAGVRILEPLANRWLSRRRVCLGNPTAALHRLRTKLDQ